MGMEKLKFNCYINFSGNAALLNNCIKSLLPQLRQFSTEENPIVVVNNTNTNLIDWLEMKEGWKEVKPPVPLVWSEAHNWCIKMARKNEEPFVMTAHTDIELLDGAMEELLSRWEQLKNETNGKWIIACMCECFAVQNHNFFYDENVFYDPYLFPLYFSDNHVARIAYLRGYKECMFFSTKIIHNKSHTIRDNFIMGKRNGIGFGYAAQAYQAIWGGSPGHETVTDPFANGFCYPLNERYYNYID